MSIPVTEKVYIDSSILVSYALGEKDNRYHMAKRVFEEAMVGRYKIVISNFLLAETLQAIRGAVTRDTFKYLDDGLTHYRLIEIANSQEFKNTVMKKSEKAFSEIVDRITKDPSHFTIEPPDQEYSGEVFLKCLSVLISTFGVFRVYRSRCEKCGKTVPCEKCKTESEIAYKAANTPDLIHISIAESLGCDRLKTMDQYFENVADKFSIPIDILK